MMKGAASRTTKVKEIAFEDEIKVFLMHFFLVICQKLEFNLAKLRENSSSTKFLFMGIIRQIH